METIVLLISVVILTLSIFIFFKKNNPKNLLTEQDNNKEREQFKYQLGQALGKIELLEQEKNYTFKNFQDEKNNLQKQLAEEREKTAQANQQLESSRAYFKAQREKIADLENFYQKAKIEFENVSNKLLDEKTAKFTEQNRLNLDGILNPLKEKIKDFEEKVDKTYRAEAEERNVLKGSIQQLFDMNQKISQEAHNLTKALKGDTKKQGNWGELILERVLESSGLVNGENYTTQGKELQLTNDDGKRFKPDVVIHLPDSKDIVIDSKVSLTAYEKLVNEDNDEQKEVYLKQHIESIKNHVKELASKSYEDLRRKDGSKLDSPDFVLLFMPIESSFSIALRYENELFDYAWSKKIVIVTPTTLLATLKTVESIWRQDKQTKNALKIAEQAGTLYEKFANFVEDLDKVGNSLDKAQEHYGNAMKKLTTGRGNLVVSTEKLKELGAKTRKQIDNKYVEDADTINNNPLLSQ